jgi:hypothetical protein
LVILRWLATIYVGKNEPGSRRGYAVSVIIKNSTDKIVRVKDLLSPPDHWQTYSATLSTYSCLLLVDLH